MQKAGRHGSYATQFWTRPSRQPYRSRREMLMAHSKKSIQRRLVLPLDAHDWARALEVLGARYAKLGRRAEDYQRVIRGIANETTPQGRHNAVHTLNTLRDSFYAGEVVASSSLWVTLVWAYVRLRFPQEGYECLLQGERRFNFSTLTKQHMGEILLPLLAEFGMFMEVKYVMENFMSAGACRHDKESLVGLVAEAAARSGLWEDAMIALTRETAKEEDSSVKSTASNLHTLASLFVSDEVNNGDATLHTQKYLHSLSTEAMRRMMCSMADDGQWVMALRCLRGLQERNFIKNDSSYVARNNDSIKSNEVGGCSRGGGGSIVHMSDEQLQHGFLELSQDEFQRILNCLGSHYRWAEATALFAAYYFPDSSVSAISEKRSLQATALNLLFSSFPRDTREFCLVPQSGAQQSYSTSSTLQEGEKKVDKETTMTLRLDTLHHPQHVVAVGDRLLSERDDVFVTDWMMAAVGPSLVQLGKWDRALHLMRQAPMFSSPKVPRCTSEAQQHMQNGLVALLYYLHTNVSLESKCYTLYHFPFIFPKEAFYGLPPPSEYAAHAEVMKQVDKAANSSDSSLPFSSGFLGTRRFASRRRPTVALHTERHDDELKRRLSSLYANRSGLFRREDPSRDPRPVPKGLHDTASGWNFYGRGGEMVFMNHKRTAHPFSMHPKVMRSLADPYRGWNLAQNSCWAHRERVRKWNGYSAV